MAEPFIGQIILGGWNFAPLGYASCDGSLQSIAQNTALFALIGTTYGGNGQTTFALPDLRSRAPMHMGSGPGLTPKTIGEMSGTETVTLLSTQIPSHSHTATLRANDTSASDTVPTSKVLALSAGDALYASTENTPMGANAIQVGNAGSPGPHENRQPYLTLNFVIAIDGIFPSRN